ncbi:MAG: chaperonin GroEL, partial [Phycisphaerae bacterium]|nr:chaperonin GroEL [Phycisphaerae bacterium]
TRAAMEEGIVAGGGVALLQAKKTLTAGRNKARGDEKMGYDIITRAIEGPARQIATNSGADGSVTVAGIAEKAQNWGYDARTGEFVDMFKAGIVDPTKVVRTALQNAASVAGLMLTTEVMVTELKEGKDEEAVHGAVS